MLRVNVNYFTIFVTLLINKKIKMKKGCVYFFKHVGLSPIKIGYTENESPINRFETFKTYAPYGAEIVGFFRCNNPLKIEAELHFKYSHRRLKG